MIGKLTNKVLIGLTPQYDYQNNFLRIHSNYMKAIESAGGIGFLIPMDICDNDIEQVIELFDGFLFPGGPDLDPFLFNEETIAEGGIVLPQRDSLEKLIFKAAYKANKPMLGICRGIQAFNIFLGGTIYQDLKTQYKDGPLIGHYQKSADEVVSHSVNIDANSLLGYIISSEQIKVNSFHHQAIDKLAHNLKIAARSKDSVIESVYDPSMKFLLGVQWHPEHLYSFDKNQFRIFQEFINSCR